MSGQPDLRFGRGAGRDGRASAFAAAGAAHAAGTLVATVKHRVEYPEYFHRLIQFVDPLHDFEQHIGGRLVALAALVDEGAGAAHSGDKGRLLAAQLGQHGGREGLWSQGFDVGIDIVEEGCGYVAQLFGLHLAQLRGAEGGAGKQGGISRFGGDGA